MKKRNKKQKMKKKTKKMKKKKQKNEKTKTAIKRKTITHLLLICYFSLGKKT